MSGLTTRALDVLRDMIFTGDLPPGSDHTEPELAQRLGMSRTPVREAALRLAAAGLVELRPRKGIRVTALSARDMGHIYDVLGVLEATAAAAAAARGLTQSDLGAMSRAIDDMDQALASQDLEGWALADDRFHAALVEAGDNPRIVEIVATYTDQVRRARHMTLRLRPEPSASNADHRTVLEAIAAGDSDTAFRVHSTHRRAARDMLVGLMITHNLARL